MTLGPDLQQAPADSPLRNLRNDIVRLSRVRFPLAVFDEIQNQKNPETQNYDLKVETCADRGKEHVVVCEPARMMVGLCRKKDEVMCLCPTVRAVSEKQQSSSQAAA